MADMVPFRQPRDTEVGHMAMVGLATGGLTPRPATQATTEFLMVVIQVTGLPLILALVIRGHTALRCIPARAMVHPDMGAMERVATGPETDTERRATGRVATRPEAVTGASTGLDTEGVMGLMVATDPTTDYKLDFNQESSKNQRKLSMIG